MLATKAPDRVNTAKKPLTTAILEPGSEMSLDCFFEKWIPVLYGVRNNDPCTVQTATDFRTGEPLFKTWRQICCHELEHWKFNQATTKHWGTRWRGAPELARRTAYFMNSLLEHKVEQKKTREETGI